MTAMILAFLIALAVANADCPTECSTCDGTTCTSCITSFYLTSGSCAACSANCHSCSNPSACQECNAGYFSHLRGCQACDTVSCAPEQYQNIATCLAGGSSGCTPCSSFISPCQTDYYESTGCTPTADRICTACTTSCPAGTYQVACSTFSDAQCLACGEGCQACSFASGVVTCTSCSEGYYLSGGSCAACSTDCIDGFYQSAPCSANADITCSQCSTCTSDTYESTVCSTASDRQCSACSSAMAYCATCSSATTCTSCSASYYVSGGGTGCTGCFSTNCNTCTGGNYASCSACKIGMFLNPSVNNCTTCMSTCNSLRRLYGVCTGQSNPTCYPCNTALAYSCPGPSSTRTVEPWWPASRQQCCNDALANTATLGDACAQYANVISCTRLYTLYPM